MVTLSTNRPAIFDCYRDHFAPKAALVITYQDSDKSVLDRLMHNLKIAGLDSRQAHCGEDFLMIETPIKGSPAFSILVDLPSKFCIEALELNQSIVFAEMMNSPMPATMLIDVTTCAHDYDPHGCCRRCGHLKPGGIAHQECKKNEED